MSESKSTRRQLAASLSAIAVLAVLFVTGVILVWWPGRNAAAVQSPATGPVAKIAAWVEPPPSPVSRVELAIQLYERALRIQALTALQQQGSQQQLSEVQLEYERVLQLYGTQQTTTITITSE